MQMRCGACEMGTPAARGEDTVAFGGGSGNREIVLLPDNHTVIWLLFSGCEGARDDSRPAFRTRSSRGRDDRSFPPQRAVTSSRGDVCTFTSGPALTAELVTASQS